MELQGYPQSVIFIVLGIGMPLALLRPYYAFLFAVLLLAGGHSDTFNETRTTMLGPFLNLTDACILVACAGFSFDRVAAKKPIWVPRIVLLVLFVLVIAAAQSFWQLGWTYKTLRAFRWAMTLPLGLFLGANMVTSADRAKKLVAVVLLGTVLSATQHVACAAGVWHARSLSMTNYYLMRIMGYSSGRAATFLLLGLLWGLPSTRGKRLLCLAIGTLFFGTVFLNQTRSLWLGAAGTVPFMLILFRGQVSMRRVAAYALLMCLIVGISTIILQQFMPGLDSLSLVQDRFDRLADRDTANVHMGTRERAFNVEMGEWWKGTFVFGRGLYFFQALDKHADDAQSKVAFNHLGYVTYLSQLGLIGFVVYAFLLPLGVIRDSRYLWCFGEPSILRYIGAFAGIVAIQSSLTFVMSGHFLQASAFVPAVFFGAVWCLAERTYARYNEAVIGERAISDVSRQELSGCDGL